MIRALLKAWEVKATTLNELNDHEEMDFSEFIGNLKTHEMKMKVCEGRESPKKKPIAFKAIQFIAEEEELWMKERRRLCHAYKNVWQNILQKKKDEQLSEDKTTNEK